MLLNQIQKLVRAVGRRTDLLHMLPAHTPSNEVNQFIWTFVNYNKQTTLNRHLQSLQVPPLLSLPWTSSHEYPQASRHCGLPAGLNMP